MVAWSALLVPAGGGAVDVAMIGLMRDARLRLSEATELTWGAVERVRGGSEVLSGRMAVVGHRDGVADDGIAGHDHDFPDEGLREGRALRQPAFLQKLTHVLGADHGRHQIAMAVRSSMADRSSEVRRSAIVRILGRCWDSPTRACSHYGGW